VHLRIAVSGIDHTGRMKIQNESRQDIGDLRALCTEVYREIRKTEGNPTKRKWADFKIIFRDKPRAKYVYYRNMWRWGGVLSLPLKPWRRQIAKLVAWFIYDKCYGRHAMELSQVDVMHITDGLLTQATAPKAKEALPGVRERNHERARKSVATAKKTLAQREREIVGAVAKRDRAVGFLKNAEKKLARYDREEEKRKAAPTKKLTDRDYAKRMAAKRRGEA